MNQIDTRPSGNRTAGAATAPNDDLSHQPVISEKVVLITGGTKGLGRELVRWLSANQARIAAIGRDHAQLAALKQSNPDALAEAIDLLAFSKPSPAALDLHDIFSHPKFEDYVGRVVAHFGRLDVVVLNAGVSGLVPGNPSVPSEWVHSTMAQFLAVAPALARFGGSLFLISSPLVYEAARMRKEFGSVPPEIDPYIATKSATQTWLVRATNWTEQELGWGNVYFIDPGSFNAGMHQEVLQHGGPILRERKLQKIQSNQLRDPAAVARAIGKMILCGRQYDPQTKDFTAPMQACSLISLPEESMTPAIPLR